MYVESWGKAHFLLTLVAANLAFFPMFALGLNGMVRRISSYDPQFAAANVVASLGSFLLGVSILPFLGNMIGSLLMGGPASANPWHATGLEWQTSSPPPSENFEAIPQITGPPYGYGRKALVS
jgi:cytochrome c oxidase subunit 1